MSAKRTFGHMLRERSGRHRARYTGPDGALHNAPHTFETRMDAEAWLTDERRLISSGRWTSPSARAETARRCRVAAGWVEHLGLPARQLGQGPAVVADPDLDAVADALQTVSDALAGRVRWRGRFESWE